MTELEEAAEAYARRTDGQFEYAKSWEEVREIFLVGARYQAELDAKLCEALKDGNAQTDWAKGYVMAVMDTAQAIRASVQGEKP